MLRSDDRPSGLRRGAGAALSVGLALVALPLDAIARQRAVDVGLVTQSWGGWAVDLLKSLGIGVVLGGGAARSP